MSKYLLPYQDVSEICGYKRFERRILGDEKRRKLFFASIYKYTTDKLWWSNIVGGGFRTMEAAMKATDYKLKEYGWEFIDWERAEKLVLLL
jgi:hypothetical protein